MPMAMPTSAWARAGASLIPSPTMATFFPASWSFRISRSLSAGSTSAITRSIPARRAMASAVRRVVAGQHDDLEAQGLQSRSTAAGAPSLRASATAASPARRPSTAAKTAVFPSRGQRLGGGREPGSIDPPAGHEPCAADDDLPPFDHGLDPLPFQGGELRSAGNGELPGAGLSEKGLGQRMLGRLFGRGHQAQELVLRRRAPTGTRSVTSGAPLVRVPVLSKTTVVSAPAVSRLSPPLIRMPFSAPFPVPTMTAVGVARPRAQGQAMIITATKLSRARFREGFGPKTAQTANVRSAMADDGGHEPAGDDVGQALDGGLGALGLFDEADDLGQHRVLADLGRPELEASGLVERGPDDLVPFRFADGQALARDHGLVHGRPAPRHDAVDRDLFPGPDDDDVARRRRTPPGGRPRRRRG